MATRRALLSRFALGTVGLATGMGLQAVPALADNNGHGNNGHGGHGGNGHGGKGGNGDGDRNGGNNHPNRRKHRNNHQHNRRKA